jgi:hypothetical protein
VAVGIGQSQWHGMTPWLTARERIWKEMTDTRPLESGRTATTAHNDSIWHETKYIRSSNGEIFYVFRRGINYANIQRNQTRCFGRRGKFFQIEIPFRRRCQIGVEGVKMKYLEKIIMANGPDLKVSRYQEGNPVFPVQISIRAAFHDESVVRFLPGATRSYLV